MMAHPYISDAEKKLRSLLEQECRVIFSKTVISHFRKLIK